jgi:uncharacterized repeat protein (TIGR03843 family)
MDILQAIKTVRQLGCAKTTPFDESILNQLLCCDMEVEGLMPWSSNYTFLVQLAHPDTHNTVLAIYKPGAGERPLWDFPERSLHKREFLSYLLSQLLGWPNIPATVLRDGPHGEGSVQLLVDAHYETHYFTVRNCMELEGTFKQVALFDLISNNADRKAGHCLQDKNGEIWAIDHGLTFHTEFKLRTVIHEVCEEAIPTVLLQDLIRLEDLLNESSKVHEILAQFISSDEIAALRQRIKQLLKLGFYPQLSPYYNVPYPPI